MVLSTLPRGPPPAPACYVRISVAAGCGYRGSQRASYDGKNRRKAPSREACRPLLRWEVWKRREGMTDGFEAAKAQRNALERLGGKIPGYRGFQDRELRRDVDKLLREHLSAELARQKGALRERARAYTEGGHLASLGGFDRLDREIDGLSQAIRFSDYGATGLFDAVKIGEAELAQLSQFHLLCVSHRA